MANRWFTQFPKTLEKEVCSIYARVTFGSSGAPTLDTTNSKGIVSVTRNSAGKYTFVFGTNSGMLDTYNRLLMVETYYDSTGNSGTAPTAPLTYLTGNSIATAGTASLQLVMTNTSGTATDPASTEVWLFKFELKNSTAP